MDLVILVSGFENVNEKRMSGSYQKASQIIGNF